MIVSSICAMARGRIIGNEGVIPWKLPSDLSQFRRLTWGKPIIMGRKTFMSLGKSLPGRTNIVISKTPGFAICGGIVCQSLENAFELIADVDECFVIGGEKIYESAMPWIQRQYLSLLQIDCVGDARYPAISPEEWEIEVYQRHCDDCIPWVFLQLERISGGCL